MAQTAGPASLGADFGANEWLVDELYAQYRQDPASVDPAWWDFFEGYRPMTPEGQATETREAGAAAAVPTTGAPVVDGHAAPAPTRPTVAPTSAPAG